MAQRDKIRITICFRFYQVNITRLMEVLAHALRMQTSLRHPAGLFLRFQRPIMGNIDLTCQNSHSMDCDDHKISRLDEPGSLGGVRHTYTGILSALGAPEALSCQIIRSFPDFHFIFRGRNSYKGAEAS